MSVIRLHKHEALSEVRIDDFLYRVTKSPGQDGSCILWFRDNGSSQRYRALGRFATFNRTNILQFIFRFATDSAFRDDIERHRFANRLERLPPLYFGQFQQLNEHDRYHAYRELFDLDGMVDEQELRRRRQIMAKKFHPDRGGSNEAMSVINEAYEYLKPDTNGASR